MDRRDQAAVDRLGRPTLIDFGGCQVLVDGVLVLEGDFTPGYSAPECFGLPRVLLACADVYSIGATLHHMLTGMVPEWDGKQGAAVRVRGSISPRVRDLLEGCLAARPSDRLADARQVLVAIDGILES